MQIILRTDCPLYDASTTEMKPVIVKKGTYNAARINNPMKDENFAGDWIVITDPIWIKDTPGAEWIAVKKPVGMQFESFVFKSTMAGSLFTFDPETQQNIPNRLLY